MGNGITEILREKTNHLIKESIDDKTLNFYFDENRCTSVELVRVWKGEETIVKIDDALKID